MSLQKLSNSFIFLWLRACSHCFSHATSLFRARTTGTRTNFAHFLISTAGEKKTTKKALFFSHRQKKQCPLLAEFIRPPLCPAGHPVVDRCRRAPEKTTLSLLHARLQYSFSVPPPPLNKFPNTLTYKSVVILI